MTDLFLQSSANISPCGKYRYWLERKWGKEAPQVFIMLNPSTADARLDDPTITRCINFAKREGAGGLIVVNLLAFRATDPKQLDLVDRMAGNGVGEENTKAIGEALLFSAIAGRPVICAWGSNKWAGLMSGRIVQRATGIGAKLMAFHINKDGNPKHPLYVASVQPLISFTDRGNPL